ncbi:MAG: hypothetical protein KDA45_03480 [Planctomycetales bacterium]|nr:hypothetical protein [Planctomycetales bacterium]
MSRLHVFWTVGTSFAVFGLQAIHAILLARLLGPTGRGEYGTAMFYAQTMIYIGLAGSQYSIARHAANLTGGSAALQRSALRVGLRTGLAAMLIAMSLSLLALPAEKSYLLPLCLICALLLPAEHLRLTALAVDHGRGAFNRYNFARIAGATVFPMLLLPLFLYGVDNLWLIAPLTVLVSAAGYLLYWAVSDTRQVWKGVIAPPPGQLLREGVPDAFAVLATDLYDRLGMFLVLWLVTFEEQGHYLTAIPAVSLLLVGPNALALFAFNFGADQAHPLSQRRAFQLAIMVLLVQAASYWVLSFWLQPLLLLLYGEAFRDALPVASVLLIAAALSGCAIVGDGYLRGRGRSSLGVWTRLASGVVMLLAVLAWTSVSPLLRVAMATALGHGFNLLLTASLIFRDIRARGRRVPSTASL